MIQPCSNALLAALLIACGDVEQTPIDAPQPMTEAAFVYPVDLWDQKISGETLLLMRISELGAVDSIMVGKSSGFREFDSAAVHGARTMKFTPGRQGERRVAMWARLPVRFTRDSAAKMGLGEE